jgi:hypothetical protein
MHATQVRAESCPGCRARSGTAMWRTLWNRDPSPRNSARPVNPPDRGRPRLPSPDQECSPSSPRPEATSTKSRDSPSKAYIPERRVKARSPLIRTDHRSAPRQRRPVEPGIPGSSNMPPRSAPTHPETDTPASRHGRPRRSGRAARDGLARVAVDHRAGAVQARCGPDGRWRLVPGRRVEAQNCSSSRTSTWP